MRADAVHKSSTYKATEGCSVAPLLQFTAGHLPGQEDSELEWETRVFSANGKTVEIALPRLTPLQLRAVARHTKKAARTQLASRPVLEIVDIIDRVIARMLNGADPLRREMDALLPVVSGFDAEMTRLGINACLKNFRRPQLLRFLTEDFGDTGLLDGFRPRPRGGWAHACGASLVGHVWAGNVPGLPLWSLISALLVKASSVGKVSSAEPLVASWFARTLAEVEPRLADTLAVVWWPGGETALEEVLCEEAEVLKVYGSDAAVAAWQRMLPAGKRLLPHGNKLSVAMVSATALDTRQAQSTARQAALDIVRWDQQGCYSPQVLYVERGGQIDPAEFARHLAGELSALQHSFPRRALAFEETNSAAQWRQALELALLRGQEVDLLGGPDTPWAIAFLSAARPPEAGALNRSACVMAVDRLDDVIPLLEPRRAWLQTVGLAASPEELFRLAPLIAQAGATRICALGHMTMPTAAWHHDGRFSLLDLVRMVDIDPCAEAMAEQLSYYRD